MRKFNFLFLALTILIGCSVFPYNTNTEMATAQTENSPPPLLTVMGWIDYYGIRPIPQGLSISLWGWLPNNQQPSPLYLVEARWIVNSLQLPVALTNDNFEVFEIRVAGADSNGIQIAEFTDWVSYQEGLNHE